jgi:hypothetical protein
MEAIEDFVGRAKNSGFGLRVAAYEFRLDLFANALREAHKRKVDVRVTFDANANPKDKKGKVFPRDENRAMAKTSGIKSLCIERVTRDDVKKPPISHHKFIVLLKSGKPQAVLTGSTNFSRGGGLRAVQRRARRGGPRRGGPVSRVLECCWPPIPSTGSCGRRSPP